MKPVPLLAFALLFATFPSVNLRADLPQVGEVDAQPLLLQVKRLKEALDYLGEPLPTSAVKKLNAAEIQSVPSLVLRLVQEALDPLCLTVVIISPESRVKVASGPAKPELAEHGWRNFLVKVVNKAGVTAPLKASSSNALPTSFGGWGKNRNLPKSGSPNLPRALSIWTLLEVLLINCRISSARAR